MFSRRLHIPACKCRGYVPRRHGESATLTALICEPMMISVSSAATMSDATRTTSSKQVPASRKIISISRPRMPPRRFISATASSVPLTPAGPQIPRRSREPEEVDDSELLSIATADWTTHRRGQADLALLILGTFSSNAPGGIDSQPRHQLAWLRARRSPFQLSNDLSPLTRHPAAFPSSKKIF